MKRPSLLDAYSCTGGAGYGYLLAGFEVTGVDIESRDYMGDHFVKGDAVEFIRQYGHLFDVIHASPPCQERSTLTTGTNSSRGWGREHRQWIPETRAALEATGRPYIIEQPTGHKGLIRRDLMLCMDMFPTAVPEPPWVMRHRDFEISGFAVHQPRHTKHRGYVRAWRGRHGDTPGFFRDGPYVSAYGSGGGKATITEMQHALGIDWTEVREELTEAIPPAYAEYIGAHARRAVLRRSH